MKGAYPTEEVAAVRQQCAEIVIHPLAVPGLDEQRHLVEILL
jgi:16S rRNA (guanine527-N7)-methyltransferase